MYWIKFFIGLGVFILAYNAVKSFVNSTRRSTIGKGLESGEKVIENIQTGLNVASGVVLASSLFLKEKYISSEIKSTLRIKVQVRFETKLKIIQEYIGLKNGRYELSEPFTKDDDVNSWVLNFYAVGPMWEKGRIEAFWLKASYDNNLLAKCNDLNISYIVLTPFYSSDDFSNWLPYAKYRVYKVEHDQFILVHKLNEPSGWVV